MRTGVEYTELAEDRDQRRALVDTVLNPSVLLVAISFLLDERLSNCQGFWSVQGLFKTF
jgi:hypothetical protein